MAGCKGMAQSCTREGQTGHWETFIYYEGGQTLKQYVPRGCGISTLRNLHKPTGHSPKLPAVAGPFLSGELDGRPPEVPSGHYDATVFVCRRKVEFS